MKRTEGGCTTGRASLFEMLGLTHTERDREIALLFLNNYKCIAPKFESIIHSYHRSSFSALLVIRLVSTFFV